MPDFEQRRKRRLVVRCEVCGGRIAWTTGLLVLREPRTAWRWQGKGTPIRYYRQGADVLVDVVCRACGHSATYPADAVPLMVAYKSRRSAVKF